MTVATDNLRIPQRKTDNRHVGAKLQLRRYFLDKYHAGQTTLVFDACQGEAIIWTRLRSEYSVRYWGVDRKAKAGRLAIDSVRLLQEGPLPYDVIDVDTYGSPWRHWSVMLPHIRKATTVFLTMGSGRLGGGMDYAALDAMGLATIMRRIPITLRGKLAAMSSNYCLSLAFDAGLQLDDVREVSGPAGQARYLGLRLVPQSAQKPLRENVRRP